MRDPAMPSLDFLLDASKMSLQDLELAALGRSSRLTKQLRSSLDECIAQLATALLARWLIENREALLRAGADPQKVTLDDLFGEQERQRSA